jgi:8-oxo-dGTP pyrophosphatase MutT (NUDIX family)
LRRVGILARLAAALRRAVPPSHAGGVVVRRDGGTVRYLVVSAKRDRTAWVLPKGHIEPGETVEEAARREVLEEAGVRAVVHEAFDVVEYPTRKGLVRARFFLMEAERDGLPHEDRRVRWLSYDEVREALGFEEARWLLSQAELAVRELDAADAETSAKADMLASPEDPDELR